MPVALMLLNSKLRPTQITLLIVSLPILHLGALMSFALDEDLKADASAPR